MAMEDPWGSPWADEIQTPNPVNAKADDFAVKPITPVKAASLALEQKTTSPWDDADDDGFGDWAEGSVDGGNGSGLDGNDSWENKTEHGLDYGLTDEGSNTPSIPWNDRTVNSENGMSKLAPSLLPKDDILRQRSPDPWALGTSREDENANAPPLQEGQHNEGDTSREPTAGMITEIEVSADLIPVVAIDELLPGAVETEHGIFTTPVMNGFVEKSNKTTVERAQNLTRVETTHQNGGTLDAERCSSRPSSSPSEQSHHDELAVDSPRTSLDEEPKRPPIPRKVSLKVQELVQHFDGLAQQEGSGEPVADEAGGQQQTDETAEEEEEEEVDDFGDFEDVESSIEDPLDEGKEDSPTRTLNEDSDVKSREPVTEQEENPRAHFLQKYLGPVEFAVDPSAFDRLYSGTEAKPTSEKPFIPDTVPHDSFTSTEQRKIWYRISRYGTMQKYNTGDDENYVRVNWAQSQVRADTLKIVARWIEEDRISGRVVLGGASKGSSMFGWNDPKPAPVPLAHAFAVKCSKQKVTLTGDEPVVEIPREWPKGLVRTRSTSGTRSLSISQRKVRTKSITSEEYKSERQLPIANFGWNAAPQTRHESKPQSPVHGERLSGSSPSISSPVAKISLAPVQNSSGISSPLPFEPTKRGTAMNGTIYRPHSVAHTSISGLPPLTTPNINNDDDDWGELVSSPSANNPPVTPPLTAPHHEAISSLSSALSSTPTIAPVTNKPTSPLKPVEKDLWAMGVDEVLNPQSMNSTTANMPNIFTTPDAGSNIFGPAKQIANQPPASNSIDPWASADFSFFETTGIPISKVTTSSVTKTMLPKSVNFSTPAAVSVPDRNERSREEIERDRIVQNVVRGLPDLSYMLKR